MRTQNVLNIFLTGILFLFIMFLSCDQEETNKKATIETNQPTEVTEATAICGGIITADGGSDITVRGVCWSTSPSPTIENDTTIATANSSFFLSPIHGLSPGATYYVRAYAINKGGVAYGLNVILKTKTFSIITSPISVSFVGAISAIGGGRIITDGDSGSLTVKARGVCWNTFPLPTIENDKTTDGVGGGGYISHMDSLKPLTTYYVRAYTSNSNGTIYGNEISFTTLSGIVNLTTNSPTSITANSVVCGASISFDGGALITSRGLCWNTSPNPTTSNNVSYNGYDIGSFSANINGLLPGTIYYVRSFAINDVGTCYGNEVSFRTQSGIAFLTTNKPLLITHITATAKGIITSDGGANVTARGICWSTSRNPTIDNSKTTDGLGLGSYSSILTSLSSNTLYYMRAYAINSVGVSYGNEESFTTQSFVTDFEGNEYNTVKIGDQVWMAENLKTTKLNDGMSIPNVPDVFEWKDLTKAGYCWYNNDATNKSEYGALYNWYTVNTGKLAPKGWHVPTDVEWTTLENFLVTNNFNYDGSSYGVKNKIAKSMASKTRWSISTNVGSPGNDLSKNNSSGFSALPGGARENDEFINLGLNGYWWSSSEYSTYLPWFRVMFYNFNTLDTYYNRSSSGYSVRCIKD